MWYLNSALFVWLALLLTRCCCTSGAPAAGVDSSVGEPGSQTSAQCVAGGGNGGACATPSESVNGTRQYSVAENTVEDLSPADAPDDGATLPSSETTTHMVRPSEGDAEPAAAQKAGVEDGSLPAASEPESSEAGAVSQFVRHDDASEVLLRDDTVETRTRLTPGRPTEELDEKQAEDALPDAGDLTTEPAKIGDGPVTSGIPIAVDVQSNEAGTGPMSIISEVSSTPTLHTEDSSSPFVQAEAQHFVSSTAPRTYYSPAIGTAGTFDGYEPVRTT